LLFVVVECVQWIGGCVILFLGELLSRKKKLRLEGEEEKTKKPGRRLVPVASSQDMID